MVKSHQLKVLVHSNQIPHFRSQASIFCKTLKKIHGFDVKKSNRLNLFSKICGYSSFSTLKNECIPDNFGKRPLYLTNTHKKRQILRTNIISLGILNQSSSEDIERKIKYILHALPGIPNKTEKNLLSINTINGLTPSLKKSIDELRRRFDEYKYHLENKTGKKISHPFHISQKEIWSIFILILIQTGLRVNDLLSIDIDSHPKIEGIPFSHNRASAFKVNSSKTQYNKVNINRFLMDSSTSKINLYTTYNLLSLVKDTTYSLREHITNKNDTSPGAFLYSTNNGKLTQHSTSIRALSISSINTITKIFTSRDCHIKETEKLQPSFTPNAMRTAVANSFFKALSPSSSPPKFSNRT